MIGRLDMVVLDAPDIDRLSSFYGELAGWQKESGDDDWITLRTGEGQKIAFQRAPDHLAPQWPGQERPQQLHLDLLADDLAAAAERAVGLGASRLGTGETWETLADPAGHPFDLCHRDGVGPVMGVYAVTIDCPAASPLSRFYSQMLGMEVRYEGEDGVLIGDDRWHIWFQPVEHYQAPRWPDPAYPQQLHLDLAVDDLDAAEGQVLDLGAARLNGGGKGFRVFADPAGHPFCLCITD